ncbi:carboxypeptidase-like regulatory domain-containing protein [Fischerella sp. PCC 9605]|uniref:carboxypeptidase-like regulatory domain-containing protein n=1 Tax=Fischerella sp. PCC 9605 TaxID=1173024 RepID=UPI0005582F45|nr:carboxypeptidase-like regulatory domain-containing protein [Fischerella sp. PCC 9605]
MSKNQTITYLGRVLDQKKHAPISGAKVSLNYEGHSVSTYTDLEGIYRLTVNFNNSNYLQGQLSIQANGYKSYNSFIKLSPKQKDLGDVRLVEPNSNLASYSNIGSSSNFSSQSQNENFIPLPLIIAIMIVMFLIMAIAIKPSPQKNPTNRRNTVINIYQQSDFDSFIIT